MTAPTTPERPPRTESGGGFQSKVGPLPMWAWIGLAAVGGIIVILYMRSKNSSAAATQAAPDVIGPDAATVANLQDQGQVFAAQIRDLQGGLSAPTPASGTTGAPPTTSNVLAGWSVYQYISNLNDQLEQQGIPSRLTYADLLALNPGLANDINNSDPAKPTFKTGRSIFTFPTQTVVKQ